MKCTLLIASIKMLKDTHALLSIHLDPFGLLIPHSRGKASNAMSSAGSSTDMTETSVSEVLIMYQATEMCRFTIRKLWVHRQSSCKLLRRTPTQLRVTLFQLQSEEKILSLHMNSRCHFYPLSNPVVRFVVYFRCYKKKKTEVEEEKVLNNSGRLEKDSFRA